MWHVVLYQYWWSKSTPLAMSLRSKETTKRNYVKCIKNEIGLLCYWRYFVLQIFQEWLFFIIELMGKFFWFFTENVYCLNLFLVSVLALLVKFDPVSYLMFMHLIREHEWRLYYLSERWLLKNEYICTSASHPLTYESIKIICTHVSAAKNIRVFIIFLTPLTLFGSPFFASLRTQAHG